MYSIIQKGQCRVKTDCILFYPKQKKFMKPLRLRSASILIFGILTAVTTMLYKPPKSENNILNNVKTPSFFSYCETSVEKITGIFRKRLERPTASGILGYQIELMPYSERNSNLIFSEDYDNDFIVDIEAYRLKNISFEDALIALDYLSDDKNTHIRIKQFEPDKLSIEFFVNGKKDTDKSGEYSFAEDVLPVSAKPELFLDKYAYNMDLDLGLSCYARWYLGIEYDRPLTKKMLSKVRFISIHDYPVKSLTGIEYFTNLSSISVNSGEITDISGLSKLENLESIDISWCFIEELPDLSGNTKLKELRLPMNNIKDISTIAKMENLVYVDLNSNFIEDISPVNKLNKLKMFSVLDNCILNFSSLKDNKIAQKAIETGCQFTYEECLENEELSTKTVKSLIRKNMTELEKELVIYSYIKDIMDYEITSGGMTPFGYAGLKYHVGVCGNYAESFALLARLAGLNVITVSSDTHEWNAILLGGKVYFIDALWDEGNEIAYYYFNRAGSVIKNIPDHSYDARRLIFPDAG